MIVETQRGAITDRLRRFFGLTGPYSGRLDETVAPVALLADLGAQPYDVNSERWIARINIVFNGTEANFLWGIGNISGNIVVIDDLFCSSGKTVSFGVGSAPNPGGLGTSGAVLSRDLISANVGGFETGVNLSPRPVQLSSYTNQIAASNRATTTFQLPAGTFQSIPVGHVLGVNMVAQLSVVTPIAANDFLFAWMRGRIFRDPSLSVQP